MAGADRPPAASEGSQPQFRANQHDVQTLADKVQEHLKTENRLEAVEGAVEYFCYKNKLEGMLKSVVTAVAKDQRWGIGKVLQDQRDPDGKQSEFKEFANECLMLLELLPCLMTVCKMYQKLYMAFLPEQVAFKTGWWKSQTYTLVDLDEKGHSIYFLKSAEEEETEAAPALRQASLGDLRQPLVDKEAKGDLEAAEPPGQWLRHRSDRGSEEEGKWVSYATKDGVRPGSFLLSSPLLTDPGPWKDPNREDQGKARLLRVKREGVPIVSCNSVRELRECFGRPRSVSIQNILDKVRSTLAGLFEERKDLVEWASELVEAMCDVSKKLDLGDVNKPKAHNLDNLFSCLLDLCKLRSETSIHDELAEKLSAFGEQDPNYGPLARCLRYNSRGLCLSDLHDSTESFLPRFLHRLCLRSWQGQETDEAKVMHVNLDKRKAEDSSFIPKHERLPDTGRGIRFVTISDTHSWDADLDLPEDGDVLLHCGNLLFQSGPLTKYHEPPQGLKDVFDLFRRDVRFKRYKAIVIVGGSHDRALFELWLKHPKKLLDMMPKNVVLLQHKSLRESFGVEQPVVVGSGPRWAAMEEGAVWLKPFEEACEEERSLNLGIKMKLGIRICCASEKKDVDNGWIVAGSGVSVAQGHRRAFQLMPSDEEREKRRKAARALLGLEYGHLPPAPVPDIVLSHGPPKPRTQGDTWDEGRGDYELMESLAKVHQEKGQHPKVVIFGGGRQFHGIVEDDGNERQGFAVVGAALTAHFYVPARPPIVFDEAVAPDISNPQTDKTGWEQFIDALQAAAKCLKDSYNSASACANKCMAPCKKVRLPKVLKKEVRLRCRHGIPTLEELPPQHLVAHWIPRRFLAPGVLDVFERKWRKACKKARKAENGNEAVLFTYELRDQSGSPLLQKLETERLEMDVPEAVWKEYVIIVDADGNKLTAEKTEELRDAQFPVKVCFPREAAEQAKLSEFDVSGPVVLFGQQALLHWILAPPLTMLAYATAIKPPGGGAFLEYNPLFCWGVFGAMFWHLWCVQKKCLSYLVLSQVHVQGSGFLIFGSKPSFTVWKMFICIFSLVGLMDVSAQCLFYGQFLASVQANPRIGQVWQLTIYESFEAELPFCRKITELFTACWLMMFFQLGYMLLHVFPMHEKMRYDTGENETCGSMPQGYTVLMSMMMGSEISVDAAALEDSEDTDWIWLGTIWLELRGFCWKCKITLLEVWPNLLELFSSPQLLWERATFSASNFVTGLEKPRKKMFKFWHADIIRVLATYGRMTAVIWSEKSIVQKRLEMELKKKKDTPNVARFFQIMFNRAKDFLMRAILMDILEKALKLEVQISVFSIDLALQQDQSSKLRACNKQMLFAIFLSFVSAIYALWSQSQTCRSLFRLLKRCEEDNMGYVHYKNLPGTRKSMNSVQRTLCCYCLCMVVMGLFIFHCILKVIMAFSCEFAVWNWKGCVCFHSAGSTANRTLILDNTSNCTLH